MITHLEPDLLEREVKWALGSVTTNKVTPGDGIAAGQKMMLLKCCTQYVSKFGKLPGGSDGKESACNVGNLGSIPESGRSPGERNGYPLQYSCLEDSMDRGAWQTTVHGVAKSWT